MQIGNVTTPFGRRPMTLTLVKGQLDASKPVPYAGVDKWKVFRDVTEARQLLGLQDRALTILDALLSFYPDGELTSDRSLVVFPSNVQLGARAHGITGTTLRRHLAALVDAGVIHRRDSPNGKRYARRDGGGEIEQAFGFDLRPLLVRAAEFAGMAQQVAEEARAFRVSREALTLCRRDVRKMISAALDEGADGDWHAIEAMYVTIISKLPRVPSRQVVESVLDEMKLLGEEVVNRLEDQLKATKMTGNDGQNERHIQNSNTDSIYELEPRSEKEQGAKPEPTRMRTADAMKAFPLGMVLRACPQIVDYGPRGEILNWRDLMGAAVVVRSMLGVSPSAYQDACEIMGPENAAATMACILERGGQINSAGGYLRDLTARSRRGEFSLGPALMALLRAQHDAIRQA